MNKYSGFLTVFLGLIFGFAALAYGIKYAVQYPAAAVLISFALFVLYKIARPFVDTTEPVQTISTVRKQYKKESDEFDVWFENNGR